MDTKTDISNYWLSLGLSKTINNDIFEEKIVKKEVSDKYMKLNRVKLKLFWGDKVEHQKKKREQKQKETRERKK